MKARTATLAAIALGLLLAAAGVLWGRYVWPAGGVRTIEVPGPVVEVAKEPKRVRKAPRQKLPPQRCEQLTEIADAKLLAEVARRHKLPDLEPRDRSGLTAEELAALVPPRSLLTLTEAEGNYRWGVETAVTIGEGEDRPTVTHVPLAPPRFAFRSDWRLEAGPVAVASADGVSAGALVELDWRLAQTGRFDHGLAVAGVLSQDHNLVAVGYTLGWGDY